MYTWIILEKLPLQPKNFYPSSIMSRDVELTWEAPEGSDRTFKYDLYYKRFEDVRYTVIEVSNIPCANMLTVSSSILLKKLTLKALILAVLFDKY